MTDENKTAAGLTDEQMLVAVRHLFSSDQLARMAVGHSRDEYQAIERAALSHQPSTAGYARKIEQLIQERDKARAALSQQGRDAERVLEAVLTAAEEWALYVEVDNAPRTLIEYLENARDTAIAAKKGETK